MLTGTMSPKRTEIRLTDEIRKAFDDWVAENGGDVSELLRNAALEKIGRADLIPTMRSIGRPKGSKKAQE